MRYIYLFLLFLPATLLGRDFTIEVGSNNQWIMAHSFQNRFDATNFPGAKTVLTIDLIDHFGIGLGYSYAHVEGDTFGYHNSLSQHSPLIRLNYTYPVFPWLRCYGGSDFALELSYYNFKVNQAYSIKKNHVFGFGINPFLGAVFYLPLHSLSKDKNLFKKFSIGFYLEFGYLWQTGIDISGQPDFNLTKENKDKVKINDIGLGRIDIHGFTLSGGLKLIF